MSKGAIKMIPNIIMPLGDPDKITETNPYLYHYTTISALHNMFQTNQIWFGNTKNMNDKAEVIGFFRTLSKLINDSFPDDTPQKQRVLDLINHKKELAHSFVMCFSILEDDAAQWERYSDNAYGVCLKFNTKTLVKICDSNKYWMKKVVYSLKEKNNHNYNRLSCYINTGLLLDSSSIKELIMELSLISLYHKHPSFQSEQEVRIIQLAEAERDSYQYKEINNTIKRMFVFDLKQHGVTFEDLIDGIIIAPRSQQSVEELKTYIDSLGFHKLSKKIRKSDCPLR